MTWQRRVCFAHAHNFRFRFRFRCFHFLIFHLPLNYIADSVSDAGLGVVKSALDTLSKLPVADKLIALFDNRSTENTSSGTFQLLVCNQAANGDVDIEMGGFYFHANKYDPRFLWTLWSKDSLTLLGYKEKLVLDEDIYANVRDEVANRLKDVRYLVSEIIQ